MGGGAVGQFLTQEEETDFWSVTLKGDFTGFQFLDYAESENEAGEKFHNNSGGKGRVLAMDYCTGDVPKNLYCKGSAPTEWYLDKDFTISINTLIPADVEEVVDPATWTGDFTGLTFKDLGDGIASWNPADTDGDLNYVGGGVYARTFCFEELAEDVTVQYKVAFKHGWNNGEIGEGGGNVTLTIPAGATAVTIVCDKENQKLYNGIAKKAAEDDKSVTLIGTIRGHDDWKPDYEGTEFDFTQFSKDIYVFQMNVAQGSWEYKIIRNPGNAWLDGGNKSVNVTAADGKLVTFVYDAENKALYDSVSDLAKVNELLAAKVKEEPVTDGVKDNANGTLTFTAVAENAQKVELVYGLQSEVEKDAAAVKTVALSPVSEGASAYKSTELYLGDNALDMIFNFKADGALKDISGDGVVEIQGVKYQKYHRDAFGGRLVNVPGTLVDNGGTQTWNPAINKMTYIGNGLYEFTFHNVAPANYEYKIAMGSWNENYGAGGVKDGANIAVTVPEKQDVTVWYGIYSGRRNGYSHSSGIQRRDPDCKR